MGARGKRTQRLIKAHIAALLTGAVLLSACSGTEPTTTTGPAVPATSPSTEATATPPSLTPTAPPPTGSAPMTPSPSSVPSAEPIEAIPTVLTAGNGFRSAAFTTEEVSAEPQRLLILVVAMVGPGGVEIPDPVVGGLGADWTLVATAEGRSSARRLLMYRSTVDARSTDRISLEFEFDLGTVAWAVMQYDDTIAAASNGEAAFVRPPFTRDVMGFNTENVIELDPPTTPAAYLSVLLVGQEDTLTPGDGWTKLFEVQRNVTLAGAAGVGREAEWTWSQPGHHLGIVAELAAP